MNITPSRTSRARLQTGRRLAHVVPIDLIERAVGAAVERGASHLPLPGGLRVSSAGDGDNSDDKTEHAQNHRDHTELNGYAEGRV